MKLKDGFLKAHWVAVLLVLFFLAATVYVRDVIIGIVTLIFAAILVNLYRKFDSELNTYDGWWEGLDKEEKSRLYHAEDIDYDEVEEDTHEG